MREELRSLRGGLALVAAIAALLLAVGCGSSGSSGDEVTVKTGSLSKTEFIEKAEAICKAVRSEFDTEFANFLRSQKPKPRDAAIEELVNSIVRPHYEQEIQRIGELGAPKGYAPEVASYLEAVKQRLDEGQEDPTVFTKTPEPFSKAIAVARKAGLDGCAESLR